MKKVFLDELPKKYGFGANKDKLLTDCKSSKGYEIKFVYENITGMLKIIEYSTIGQNVTIEYNHKIYTTKTNNLINCKLCNILNPQIKEYKYKIDEVIKNNFSKIIILQQIKMKNKKSTIKGYQYQCLKCGNIDTISENNLLSHQGCNVCCIPSKKVLKGYNDIATTHPYLVKYFANKEDTYTHTYSSNKKILMKCPNCGCEKEMQISNLYNQGFNCQKCSDGISYPEKFMFNILQQLRIKFQTQLTKNNLQWCKKYKYDFYFEYNNEPYICEINGEQHYRYTGRGRTLREEQNNDELKKRLAVSNGIKKDNYIVIDCRKSELEFIKNNILNSKLNDILDLSKIDWLKCHEFACSNRVKEVCELWNNGIHSTAEIGVIMKLNRHTINRYLQQAVHLNWCDYDVSQVEKYRIENCKKARKKSVKCITLNKIYDSMIDAEKELNVKYTSISACCNKKVKSAGKMSDGTKLEWEYIA